MLLLGSYASQAKEQSDVLGAADKQVTTELFSPLQVKPGKEGDTVKSLH